MTRSVLKILTVCAALTLAAASAPTFAQQKEKPPAAGPAKDFTIPTPRNLTLPNGMPVTMVSFGQVPKVTIRVVVSAANVHEQKEEVWLADLTGIMMREGTTTLTADAEAVEVAAMGGELAINVGPDTTSVGADVISERAADAVRLLNADRKLSAQVLPQAATPGHWAD